jgi:hypothetical protein
MPVQCTYKNKMGISYIYVYITNKVLYVLYVTEMYQMITLGGDAELELVDSLDPFSEGIVFRYMNILIGLN